jgi:GR25 family glycosyltransferase involved in LPS biosynthesis
VAVIPVYIINLPEDYHRYEQLAQELSGFHFIDVHRIEAVRGRIIPDLVCHLLTRNEYSHRFKGTLGCFLSHLSAWEAIAQSRAPFSVIIEDDVQLRNLAVLADVVCPDPFDIAFCNDRTSYPLREVWDGSSGYIFRELLPSLEFIAANNSSIGGYGYFLSPSGATKLLSYVREDSLFSHVDLRLMAYSLDRVSKTLEGISAQGVKILQDAYSPEHSLVSFSFYPPITEHETPASGQSRREAEDLGLPT